MILQSMEFFLLSTVHCNYVEKYLELNNNFLVRLIFILAGHCFLFNLESLGIESTNYIGFGHDCEGRFIFARNW